MKLTKKLISLFFISTLLFACSKEEGPEGPKGDTGSANVIYSDWFDTQLSNSIVTVSASFTVDEPLIDSNIMNSGTVLVYGKRDDIVAVTVVYQLPIVFGASRQQSFYYRVESEKIRITVAANDQGGSAGEGDFIEQYRYIIIPGGVSVNDKSAQNFSSMSYQEIVDYFNIPY